MAFGIRSIQDVAEKHMCTGCGACAYIQPADVQMVDDLDQGRRPLTQSGADTREALAACPGLELEHDYDRRQPGLVRELEEGWGPVLELWEGYASDDEVRFKGSSGGAATALALFALEHQEFAGVLHIAARPDVPYLNHTVYSTTRAELVAATGSRYAPASPCDSLERIESAAGPSVFIGKPCDVAGARKAAKLRPELDTKLGLTIGIFCAGAPSTRGTLEMIRQMGFEDSEHIESVRYRGQGWPGEAVVQGHDASLGGTRRERMTYAHSWGKILQRHRQWRCYVCADHTGEFADIAVGDPWYREIPEGEMGRSLVLARTERGRRFLQAAIEAGALTLERVEAHILPDSQMNLLHTRGAVFGRSWACRMLGVAAPRFKRMATGSIWLKHLSLKQRAQAFYGTWKRVFTKRLYKRSKVTAYQPDDAERSQVEEVRKSA